jgi:hypothetical protein
MRSRSAVVLALLVSGCASPWFTPNVTTMTLTFNADGSVRVSSGKDVKLDTLTFTDPKSGITLDVKGYSSAANTDAINAQAAREQIQIDGMIRAMQTGASMAGSAAKGAMGMP